jgi:hypothetical protein
MLPDRDTTRDDRQGNSDARPEGFNIFSVEVRCAVFGVKASACRPVSDNADQAREKPS